jgi:hypothetical protein
MKFVNFSSSVVFSERLKVVLVLRFPLRNGRSFRSSGTGRCLTQQKKGFFGINLYL